MKKALYPLIVGLICLLGCEAAIAQTARLQVIHNSPSPTVDVYVNGVLTLDDFAFRTASPFVTVPAGVQLNIGVALSTSTSVADTLVNFPVTLTSGETYFAMANGIVGDPTTPFQLTIKDGVREASSAAGDVDFLVVHGSPDAPAVDVIARGVGTLVDSAAFGDVTDYLSVAPDLYILDITPANDNSTIVATYAADLSGLADSAATVFASGFLTPGAGEPAFGLFAALPGGAVVELPDTALARLQVVHNSPTPTVDVYVNGGLLLNDFEFRTATPFIDVPAGVQLEVGVAPANSMSVDDTIANFGLTLANNGTYIAVAHGIVTNQATPFTISVIENAQEMAMDTANVDFAVFHGSTDAPEVDVFARGVAQLVDDLSYGEATGYTGVPAAAYLLDITPSMDNETIVASYWAELTGLKGGAALVFASGYLTPGPGDPAFGLFAALPDGNIVEFPDTALARLQVVHNSPEPTVDVYLNGGLLLDNFAFRDATPFIDAPAEVELNIGVALDNSTGAGDTLVNFPVTLENGQTYIAVASGVVGNQTTPFTLLAVDNVRESADTGVDLLIHHGSPDAPAVDVSVDGVGVIVDDVAYTGFSDYVNAPATALIVNLSPAEDSLNIVASYDADLTGLDGNSLFVFASGFFSGDQPAFGLWVADVDGNTFALPQRTVSIDDLPQNQNLFSLYPNPAREMAQIELELEKASDVSIRIFNAAGQEVYNEVSAITPGLQTRQIQTQQFQSGIYTVLVSTDEVFATKKLLVIH
ncbi:DUF4397 domain-containing protein [Pontibacter sp. G13]|uniref:DUF4397 domain-containing protein n=1 Tax=Pontibacter sp. G13 TaxID=3074898 RepID=UPI00288961A8|nr:DUF4397 domain-containing protein [Pontibacter sp. G13]WNJ18856.1 DUF4397 domain-containing protein [Pontibacter sp. G13]